MAISWFGLIALSALFFVLVSGLANPRTRGFVVGLGALLGLGVLLFGFLSVHAVHFPEPPHVAVQVQEAKTPMKSQTRAAAKVKEPEQKSMIASSPVLTPQSSSIEANRSKMTLLAALRQAIVQAWTARGSAPVAEAPEKPAKPQPPAWVNAAPTMEDNCYRMSVRVGPFVTPLECEQELTKALQGAVAEYAELSFGAEAAAMRLPDDILRQLVAERWTEVRPMAIDGGTQEMVSLHALVVFNPQTQEQVKIEAQKLVIGRRVRGAAVIFSGLLGVLALAWGSLRLATRKPKVATT